MRIRSVAAPLAAGVLLAGCAGGSGDSGTPEPTSGSPSRTAAAGNGAIIVSPARVAIGAQRYAIKADGTLAAPEAVPWETGADAETTLLKDAVGPWALTATIELPLSDVSATTQLQVRHVQTGEVAHQIDVPGWCSGPDGASYPCLLLDEKRMVRTTPIDGQRDGTITISSTETGETLAEHGPFTRLGSVSATSSPGFLIVATQEGDAPERTFRRVDVSTGETTQIGTAPFNQPPLCTLGTDSLLTYQDTMQVVGPAHVAPVEVPEMSNEGPGAVGCSADGAFAYVRTSFVQEQGKDVVIDAIALADGTRTKGVLTVPSEAGIWVTR